MKRGERFLAAAADLFEETGKWPKVEDVQDLLVYRRDSTDAEREVRRLPPTHGRHEGDSVCPTVQGIYVADPSHPTLEYFERTLVFSAKRYKRRKRREKVTVSRSEIVEAVGLTEEQAERALALLVSESLASIDPERDDVVVVSPAIRHYFAVRTAGEYVEVKGRMECRLCRARKMKIGTLARRAGPPALHVVLSALAIALATFLIWLAAQAFGGGQSSSPPRHPGEAASAVGAGRAEVQAAKTKGQRPRDLVTRTPSARRPPAPADRR